MQYSGLGRKQHVLQEFSRQRQQCVQKRVNSPSQQRLTLPSASQPSDRTHNWLRQGKKTIHKESWNPDAEENYNPTFYRWEIWCPEKPCELSAVTLLERARISSLMFFLCINRKQLPSIRNHEPLPTSAILATTQAKKEGEELVLASVLVLWHGPLLPQYYGGKSHSLSVNHSAWPSLECSIPGQKRTLGPAWNEHSWSFLTLWKMVHTPSASHKCGESWQVTICKVVKNVLQRRNNIFIDCWIALKLKFGKSQTFSPPHTHTIKTAFWGAWVA